MTKSRRRVVAETVLFPAEPAWPACLDALAALGTPARRLRVRGELPDLRGAVAIVGTRAADDEGLAFAERLAAAVAGMGRAVVSGGARGIDAAAHRGALSVDGLTVAVLPTGFRPSYPRQHAQLFDAIAGSGALVCEVDDGLAPRPGTFLARNRLIAALASTVVVVQAPIPSGALSTAALGRRLGKRILAVPHTPWDEHGSGCLALLASGAEICTSPRDVLSVPAPKRGPFLAEASASGGNPGDLEGLDETGRVVLAALGSRSMSSDRLASRLSLPVASLLTVLLRLELDGLIATRPDGTYARAKSPAADPHTP
jgi:DNA processing protein